MLLSEVASLLMEGVFACCIRSEESYLISSCPKSTIETQEKGVKYVQI